MPKPASIASMARVKRRVMRSGSRIDVVTLLHPFVTRYALLDWGLPADLFDPATVVGHAVDVLRPGGILVAVHQTAAERDAMLGMLRGRGERVAIEQVRTAPAWLTADRHLRADRQIVVARHTGE